MDRFVIDLDDDAVRLLERLVAESPYEFGSVEGLLGHLAQAAADGVRRPGAWERDWLTSATGWPPFER